MPDNNGKRSWTEYFRILTPFLLLILTFVGSTINSRLDRLQDSIIVLDDKIFEHLTNEELHMPRTYVVTKSEFDLVSKIREQQFARIETELCNIRDEIKRRK